MLIKGKVFDIENKKPEKYFYYNGENLQFTNNPNLTKINKDLSFWVTTIKENKEINELFLKQNKMLSVDSVEFNEEEKQHAINYIKEQFPVTFKYCDLDKSEIIDWIYCYDYAGIDSYIEQLEDIQGYLEGYTGCYGNNNYYELIDSFLSDSLLSTLEYLKDKNMKFVILDYFMECINQIEYVNQGPEYDYLDCYSEIENFINPELKERLESNKKEELKLKKQLELETQQLIDKYTRTPGSEQKRGW